MKPRLQAVTDIENGQLKGPYPVGLFQQSRTKVKSCNICFVRLGIINEGRVTAKDTKAYDILPTVVDSACAKLEKEGKAARRYVETPSSTRIRTRFIYSTSYAPSQIDETIQRKAQLLARHYDLSSELALHGEKLVADVCEQLGYTEIETRKEKHSDQNLLEVGIERHDIDVFAKHPTGTYYQNIEVKNRRAKIEEGEIDEITRTTLLAHLRWQLDIRTALVAVRTTRTAEQRLRTEDIPIAYAGKIHAPEKYRELYEELNRRLAYEILITDSPSTYLQNNIAKYILAHSYRATS